jgi:hypothetical protein
MSPDEKLPHTLDQLALAACVVDVTFDEFELPEDIEERADLLLAVEDLAISIAKLHKIVSDAVWGNPVPNKPN